MQHVAGNDGIAVYIEVPAMPSLPRLGSESIGAIEALLLDVERILIRHTVFPKLSRTLNQLQELLVREEQRLAADQHETAARTLLRRRRAC
jgi:hypothetical protein